MSPRRDAGPASVRSKWRLLLSLVAIGVGVLLVGGLVVGVYFFQSLTASQPPETYGVPAFLEAKSAADKLKLLEDSERNRQNGYVRLTEAEINSLLHWIFFGGKAKPLSSFPDAAQLLRSWDPSAQVKPAATPEGRLLHARVRFDRATQRTVWYTWVSKSWRGHTWTLQWERQGTLAHDTNGWGFALADMRLGNRQIPPAYWERVQRALGGSDATLDPVFSWLRRLPAVELTTNATTQVPELKLYNYPEPLVLGGTKP